MDYVRFGRSNLTISRIGLGTMGFGERGWRPWVVEEEEARAVVERAFAAGINFVDTCNVYSGGSSETILGNVLWDVAKRDEVVLATKAGHQMSKHVNGRGFSRKHLIEAVEASLRRLRTDYVDIFQTHIWDPTTDLDELVDAFDTIVKQGKALYVGAAQMPAWSFVRCVEIAKKHGAAQFLSMQCEYNACHRETEREMLPYCLNQNIAFIPFSPLARGFLTMDPDPAAPRSVRQQTDELTLKQYHRSEDCSLAKSVRSIAERRGVSPMQIALAWVLAQPGVTAPIFGPTKPSHVDDAVAALSVRLAAEDIAEIDGLYAPRPTRAGGH